MTSIFGDSGDRLHQFIEALREVGRKSETRYVAVEYTGEPITLSFELFRKTWLFKKSPVAVGNDSRELRWVGTYVSTLVQGGEGKGYSVRSRETVIRNGNFQIEEVNSFQGGDLADVEPVFSKFNIVEADRNIVMHHEERHVLTYLQTTDESFAKAFAVAVQQGATSPATPEQVGDTQQMMVDWLGRHPAETRDLYHRVVLADRPGVPDSRRRELIQEWDDLEVLFEPQEIDLTEADMDSLIETISQTEGFTPAQRMEVELGLVAIMACKKVSETTVTLIEASLGLDLADTIREQQSQIP